MAQIQACRAPAALSSAPKTASRRPSAALAPRCSSYSSSEPSSSSASGLAASPQRRELLAAGAAAALLLALPRPASAEVPRAYEETAVKLVAALREAISTDLSDAEERQVRRAADPAKSLVREFLSRWKGAPAVAGEESYAQLNSAIQQLGAFYQQNGQRARLTPEVGQRVLDTLDAAEAALPAQEKTRSLLPFF